MDQDLLNKLIEWRDARHAILFTFEGKHNVTLDSGYRKVLDRLASAENELYIASKKLKDSNA